MSAEALVILKDDVFAPAEVRAAFRIMLGGVAWLAQAMPSITAYVSCVAEANTTAFSLALHAAEHICWFGSGPLVSGSLLNFQRLEGKPRRSAFSDRGPNAHEHEG